MKRITTLLFAMLIVFSAVSPVLAQVSSAGTYRQEGIASWYGSEYDGRLTASGEIFDSTQFTAAHPTLPFGTLLTVTNTYNNLNVIVRVNDRGPFVATRIIDLSMAAAEALDMLTTGTAMVIVESESVPGLGQIPESAPALVQAPAQTAPVVTQPEQPPAQPAPAVTQPVQPPAQPAPVQPAPTVTQPVQPPAQPAPVVTQPVQPAPTQPAPVVTQPVQPAPAQPAPVVTQPVQPLAQPAPVVTLPVQPPQPVQTPVQPPALTQPVQPGRAAVIIGGIPGTGTGKLYRLQVGAFRVQRNAIDAFNRLQAIGLNPAYERYNDLYRVVLARLRPEDIPSIAEKIYAAGFPEALIREEL